jgi:integrase
VRLPPEERPLVDPPTAAEVETIIATVPQRWRLALRALAETGMRVGELHALEWGDVDESGLRFRVKAGKSAAARRWVAVPEDVVEAVARRAHARIAPPSGGFSPVSRRTWRRTSWPGLAKPLGSLTGIRTIYDIAMRRCRLPAASR